jgi:hypothetical protein
MRYWLGPFGTVGATCIAANQVRNQPNPQAHELVQVLLNNKTLCMKKIQHSCIADDAPINPFSAPMGYALYKCKDEGHTRWLDFQSIKSAEYRT